MALCSNKKISVVLSPTLIPAETKEGEWNVVVVDILRATTAICAAFASGCQEIVPLSNLDTAISYSQQGYKVVAERGGNIVAGADYGNSPTFFYGKDLRKEKLAYSTTNGTRAISLASDFAQCVFIGAFSNLTCLTKALVDSNANVTILCSGWEDTVSIEDTLFAGALSSALCQHHFTLSNDAAELSASLWCDKKNNILDTIRMSEHGQRLIRLGVEQDIEFAAKIDTCNCVPRLMNQRLVL